MMQSSKGQFKLSPSEITELVNKEKQRRRLLRIQEVRAQAKINSAQIRANVATERERQLAIARRKFKDEQDKENKLKEANLKAKQLENMKHIGESHMLALIQPDRENERKEKLAMDKAASTRRGSIAVLVELQAKEREKKEKNRPQMLREKALSTERERAARVAQMAPPLLHPVDEAFENQDFPRKYTNPLVFVEREHFDNLNAKENAILEEEREAILKEGLKKSDRARKVASNLRFNEAFRRQVMEEEQRKVISELDYLQRLENSQKWKGNYMEIPSSCPINLEHQKVDRQSILENAFLTSFSDVEVDEDEESTLCDKDEKSDEKSQDTISIYIKDFEVNENNRREIPFQHTPEKETAACLSLPDEKSNLSDRISTELDAPRDFSQPFARDENSYPHSNITFRKCTPAKSKPGLQLTDITNKRSPLRSAVRLDSVHHKVSVASPKSDLTIDSSSYLSIPSNYGNPNIERGSHSFEEHKKTEIHDVYQREISEEVESQNQEESSESDDEELVKIGPLRIKSSYPEELSPFVQPQIEISPETSPLQSSATEEDERYIRIPVPSDEESSPYQSVLTESQQILGRYRKFLEVDKSVSFENLSTSSSALSEAFLDDDPSVQDMLDKLLAIPEPKFEYEHQGNNFRTLTTGEVYVPHELSTIVEMDTPRTSGFRESRDAFSFENSILSPRGKSSMLSNISLDKNEGIQKKMSFLDNTSASLEGLDESSISPAKPKQSTPLPPDDSMGPGILEASSFTLIGNELTIHEDPEDESSQLSSPGPSQFVPLSFRNRKSAMSESLLSFESHELSVLNSTNASTSLYSPYKET